MRQLKIGESITNRDTHSVYLYLKEIGQGELLTAEQEVLLAQRIKEGDMAALERLTKANLCFVVSVAKQYQHNGVPLSDLINEGNLGLIRAAKRFDETKGFKFISYAVWWIRDAILNALAQQLRTVRLPFNQIGALSKIEKATATLQQAFEREPALEEIAECLETTLEKVVYSLAHSGRQLSLHAHLSDSDQSLTLLDVVENPDPSTDADLLFNDMSADIQRALATLNDKDRRVLVLFFGLDGNRPLKLKEIAGVLKLTGEAVRQIKNKALEKIKNSSQSKILKVYFD